MWDSAKAEPGDKFTAIMPILEKKFSTISNLNFHFKKLEKDDTIKHHRYIKKEIIKTRAKISKIEKIKSIEKNKKSKSYLFKRSMKIIIT